MTGIGITTTPNRKDFCTLSVSQIEKHTGAHRLFIHNDDQKRGVAYSKNQCLEALKDCAHIFLFDDDCFPKKDNWDTFFIDHAIRTAQGHFMYLQSWGKIKKISENNGIESFNNSAGCMMYLSNYTVSMSGLMDEAFGRYGYEHAEYTHRIFNRGLNTMGVSLCPKGGGEYIHSLDYDGSFNGIQPRPSMSVTETLTALEVSSKHFFK